MAISAPLPTLHDRPSIGSVNGDAPAGATLAIGGSPISPICGDNETHGHGLSDLSPCSALSLTPGGDDAPLLWTEAGQLDERSEQADAGDDCSDEPQCETAASSAASTTATATATATAGVHSGAPAGCSTATALEAGDDTCAWSEAPGEAMYARLAAAGLTPSMTGRVGATDEECWSACDQGGRTPCSSPAMASSSSSEEAEAQAEAEAEAQAKPRLAGGASDVQPAESKVADEADVVDEVVVVATGAPAPEAKAGGTMEAAVQVDTETGRFELEPEPELARLRAMVAQQRTRAAEDSREIAQLTARVADLERELSAARAALSPAQRDALQQPTPPPPPQPTPTPTHVPPTALAPQPGAETPLTVVAPLVGALPPTPPRGSRARPIALVDGAPPPDAAAAELAVARAEPPPPPPPPPPATTPPATTPPATTDAAAGVAGVAGAAAPESPPLPMAAQPQHHTRQPSARRMQSEMHLHEAGLAAADLATKLEALRAQARVLAEWPPSSTTTGGEGGGGSGGGGVGGGGDGGGGGGGDGEGGDGHSGAGGGMVAMAPPPPPELPPFYVPPVSLVSDVAAEARSKWAAGAAKTNAEAVQALRALKAQSGDGVGGVGGSDSGAALSERLHALANSFRRDLASEQLQQAAPMQALHADASAPPLMSAAALPPPLPTAATPRPLPADATAVASHDAAITDSLLWLRGRQARSPLRASASAGMKGPAAAAACGLPPTSAANSIGAPGRLSAIVSATLGVTPVGAGGDASSRNASSSWAQHAAGGLISQDRLRPREQVGPR